MDNFLFSSASSDYYVRYYKINPALFNGIHIEVNAECLLNTDDGIDERYFLEIYFSAENIGFREHIIGLFFGEEQMNQESLDKEIDGWVEQMITEPTFPQMVHDYLYRFTDGN